MDDKLRAAERAFYSSPRIETLLCYAIETERAGIYPYVLNWGHVGEDCSPLMAIMAELETQRRRKVGESGPDALALWLDEDAEDLFATLGPFKVCDRAMRYVHNGKVRILL